MVRDDMIGNFLQVPHDGTDGIAKSRVEHFFRNRLEVGIEIVDQRTVLIPTAAAFMSKTTNANSSMCLRYMPLT